MKMVIGGAYQGKKAYASAAYNIKDEEWIDGNTCSLEGVFQAKGIFDFHKFIQRNEGLEEKIDEICEKNSRIIIVTTEVGAGVVPIQASDRIWRERCGRICTRLAAQSEEVVRVCCGIGQKIKG